MVDSELACPRGLVRADADPGQSSVGARIRNQPSRLVAVTPRLPQCVLAGCTALIAACGSDQTATTPPPKTVPDKPPTAGQLARIGSTATAPFFWLGSRYGGQKLTRATLTATDPPDSIFQYGTPTCRAGIGCSYDLGVATLRDREPVTTQRCWRRLGPALVLGCDQAAALQVYTGAVEVFLSSRAVKPARGALALRLKLRGTAAAPRLEGLAAPKPFTCEEARSFPAEFRARVPVGLAPRRCQG